MEGAPRIINLAVWFYLEMARVRIRLATPAINVAFIVFPPLFYLGVSILFEI